MTCVYNWARPRDLSHYETFGHYHRTLSRQVEALSVTPFARRARSRADGPRRDADLHRRLAERVALSNAQQPSMSRAPIPAGEGFDRPAHGSPTRDVNGSGEQMYESRVGRVLREQREHEQARGRDHGIE